MTQPDSSICDTTILLRNNSTLTTQIGSDTVMMAPAQAAYYGLDPVGTDIWARLEQPITLGQLIDALIDAYQGDPAQIRRDVQALIRVMLDHGLINTGS